METPIRIETSIQISSKVILPDGSVLAEVTPIVTVATEPQTTVTILHIVLRKALEPSDIKYLIEAVKKLQKYFEGELLILSGRGPIWMHMTLGHELGHVFRALAVLDPKLRGAVVVASHTRMIEKGQIVKLPSDVLERITQLESPQ